MPNYWIDRGELRAVRVGSRRVRVRRSELDRFLGSASTAGDSQPADEDAQGVDHRLTGALRALADAVTQLADALEALEPEDRALWATFVYAGLRRGEGRALRWKDVDLPAGVIRVERSWDPKAGVIEPKSTAGRRAVPIGAALRALIAAHKLASRQTAGLVFARSDGTPFNPCTVQARAKRAWKAAGLHGVTPHEARHTYASLMIAAGVNAKTLSTYMGHGNIAITLDRYGHLFPGAEHEAAARLDAYLAAAADASS